MASVCAGRQRLPICVDARLCRSDGLVFGHPTSPVAWSTRPSRDIFNRGDEPLLAPNLLVAHSVDEKSRRTVHTTLHPTPKVVANPIRIRMLCHLPQKSGRVQPERRGILDQKPVL